MLPAKALKCYNYYNLKTQVKLYMNNNISFYISDSLKALRDFADLAYHKELFVKGFTLEEVLPEIFTEDCDEILRAKNIQIALLKKNDNLIGICVFSPKDLYSINTYIVNSERGFGYSIDLFRFMLENIEDKNNIRFGEGEIQSLLFFKKLVQLNLATRDYFHYRTFFKIEALINFEDIKKSGKILSDSDLAELNFFSDEEKIFLKEFLPDRTHRTIPDLFYEANMSF